MPLRFIGLILDTLATTSNNSYLLAKNYASGSIALATSAASFPALGVIGNLPVIVEDHAIDAQSTATNPSAIVFRNELLNVPVPTNVPATIQNIIANSSSEDVELFYLARYFLVVMHSFQDDNFL